MNKTEQDLVEAMAEFKKFVDVDLLHTVDLELRAYSANEGSEFRWKVYGVYKGYDKACYGEGATFLEALSDWNKEYSQ